MGAGRPSKCRRTCRVAWVEVRAHARVCRTPPLLAPLHVVTSPMRAPEQAKGQFYYIDVFSFPDQALLRRLTPDEADVPAVRCRPAPASATARQEVAGSVRMRMEWRRGLYSRPRARLHRIYSARTIA